MNRPFWQDIIDRYYPADSPLRDIYLSHCRSVAQLALEINSHFRNQLDPAEVEAAAMLHDIGIFLTHAPSIECHGEEFYIRHGYLGADLLRREGVDDRYARVCERHTGVGITTADIERQGLELPSDRTYMPESTLEKLICFADKFYSKSGSGNRKPLARVEKSIGRFGTDNLERFRLMMAELNALSYEPIDL